MSRAVPATPARSTPSSPQTAAAATPDLATGPSLRSQLTWVTIAWVFGSAWLWAISGAAMTQFARALGTPDFAFGILAALPFVGTLFQIPASYWLERYGYRKPLFMVTASLGRLLWTVVALIPWFLPGFQAYWWHVMLGLLLITWVSAQVSGPAWMAWMSDVIPRRVRGRYFAIRRFVSQPIGLAVTLAIGYALDLVEAVKLERPDLMLHVTAGILGVAGLLGALDILCFRKVLDPKPPKPNRDINLFSLLGQPLRDANFRKYLAFNLTFTLGVGFMGQYVWLYTFDVCGWTNGQANLLILGIPMIAQMVTFKMWGRLMDRLGKKPVLLITGAFTVFGSVGWLMIDRESFWLGYLFILFVTLTWPGMEMANFNFTLDMAGSKTSATSGHHRAAGTAYVALNSVAVAIGGVVSGLLAALIASALPYYPPGHPDAAMAFVVPLPGVGGDLTYHGVLFLISTVLRAASLAFALGLHEPRATGTRDAIRYMTTGFYSNIRSAVLFPPRAAGAAFRTAYRLKR